jgi:hypothetical protein
MYFLQQMQRAMQSVMQVVAWVTFDVSPPAITPTVPKIMVGFENHIQETDVLL